MGLGACNASLMSERVFAKRYDHGRCVSAPAHWSEDARTIAGTG